jgi:hypothetical protein
MYLTHNRIAWSRILALGVLLAALTAAWLPAAKPAHASATFTVGAKVTDAETNLAKSNMKLYVDGNRKDFSYDRSTDGLSFTPGTNLSYGKYTVKIVATDASGAVGTKSWSFTVAR